MHTKVERSDLTKGETVMAKCDWFKLWMEDRKWILDIMIHNMTADLEAGYDYWGKSITEQREAIEEFKKQYDADMDRLAEMEPSKVQHWCYVKLLKYGAI